MTMTKMTLEISAVQACSVNGCAYNSNQKCHAKAITIGDAQTPGCDTSFSNGSHVREVVRVAGVGACKVSSCRFNDDYECTAGKIVVSTNQASRAQCMTYST